MKNTQISPELTLSHPKFTESVASGLSIIQQGGSKSDACRLIYKSLCDQPKAVIIQAFIDGATVTPQGAPTYFYNISRQFYRQQNVVL